MSQAKEGEIHEWVRDRAMASLSARSAGEKEREKFFAMYADACQIPVGGGVTQYVYPRPPVRPRRAIANMPLPPVRCGVADAPCVCVCVRACDRGAVDDFIRSVDTKTLILYLVGNDRLVCTVSMPHDAIKKKGTQPARRHD